MHYNQKFYSKNKNFFFKIRVPFFKETFPSIIPKKERSITIAY